MCRRIFVSVESGTGLIGAVARRWDEAEAGLAALRAHVGTFSLGGYYDLMADRIAAFRQAPPLESWIGIHDALSK